MDLSYDTKHEESVDGMGDEDSQEYDTATSVTGQMFKTITKSKSEDQGLESDATGMVKSVKGESRRALTLEGFDTILRWVVISQASPGWSQSERGKCINACMIYLQRKDEMDGENGQTLMLI